MAIDRKRRDEGLHLLALSTLAVAQPLLYVLGRNGEFFVASRTGPFELLALVAIVVIGLPAVLILVELVAGLFGPRVRRTAHLALVALLATAVALPALGKLWAGPATYVVATAAALGIIGAITYFRFAVVRLMLSFLAVLPLVATGAFVFFSDATKIFFPPRVTASSPVKVTAETPVMVIIFDELPLASLLDNTLSIDGGRYPNFAQLAATSHWFRNATAVTDHTSQAVPAILTGRYPTARVLATASELPDNLFTLLAGSYAMQAAEPVTDLCPKALCEDVSGVRNDRATFAADTAVVYGHVLLPPAIANTLLPRIDQGWARFEHDGRKSKPRPARARALTPDAWGWYEPEFENAVKVSSSRRMLYVLHYLLPHGPWRFLPGGHEYPSTGSIPGLGPGEQWIGSQLAVDEAYQRHLLQVGYADKVLGTLLGKLRAAGIDDEALVIVVADHGCSFHAGDNRRRMTRTNWPDILRVPLLIKLPGQSTGIVDDRPVQTIDILPTIADALRVKLPFRVDGHSALRKVEYGAGSRQATAVDQMRLNPPNGLDGLSDSVHRKTELFGTGADVRKLFGRGPYWELVGRRVDELPMPQAGGLTASVTEPEQFAEVEPEAFLLPALISGGLSGDALNSNAEYVALALNGTVRAVTPLMRHGKQVRFTSPVPAISFQRGRNDLEILLLGGSSQDIRLTRATITRREYALKSTGTREYLESVPGQRIVLRAGAVRGAIDSVSTTTVKDRLTIVGWVADPKHADVPRVLVFADGRFITSTVPKLDRADVMQALGDETALRSGFAVTVPMRNLRHLRRIRVIGLTTRQVASELGASSRNLPYVP